MAAICVQSVDVQCVLQFTLVHAAGCVLHRRTSRVIHRLKLCSVYFAFFRSGPRGPVPPARGRRGTSGRSPRDVSRQGKCDENRKKQKGQGAAATTTRSREQGKNGQLFKPSPGEPPAPGSESSADPALHHRLLQLTLPNVPTAFRQGHEAPPARHPSRTGTPQSNFGGRRGRPHRGPRGPTS